MCSSPPVFNTSYQRQIINWFEVELICFHSLFIFIPKTHELIVQLKTRSLSCFYSTESPQSLRIHSFLIYAFFLFCIVPHFPLPLFPLPPPTYHPCLIGAWTGFLEPFPKHGILCPFLIEGMGLGPPSTCYSSHA